MDEAAGEIEDMREEMENKAAEAVIPSYGGFVGDDEDDDIAAREDPVAGWEHEQQVQMMRDQDLQLDGVFRTVGNLRAQANDMGRELEEQSEMIGALDKDAERVQGKLEKGMRNLKVFIRKNEGALLTLRRLLWTGC